MDGEKVTFQCGSFPIKGLVASVDMKDGEDADWSDNMFDLMPGDVVSVVAKGLDGRPIRLRHLGAIGG